METVMPNDRNWTPGVRVLFRFVFVYVVLYTIPPPVGFLLQWSDYLSALLWNPIVTWAGQHIFDKDITVLPNGSTDTTWNYVQILVIATIATLATIVWTAADWKRAHYDTLLLWFMILVRVYLGFVMLNYGLAKIVNIQFPFPPTETLATPVGQLSPTMLMWTFMGYSKAYNLFVGSAEVLGAMLLFSRRTTLLGALITIGVMANVVMLNLTYDVAVKLTAIHLLAMAILIVTPQLNRLFNFFILNKATAPEEVKPFFTTLRARRLYTLGKIALILSTIIPLVSLVNTVRAVVAAQRAEETEVYDVEEQKFNGVTIPEQEVTRRWKKLLIQNKVCNLQYMDGAKVRWNFSYDTLAKTVNLISLDSGTAYRFQYATLSDNFYLLKGKLDEDSIQIALRKNNGHFALVDHKSHWVQEYFGQ